MPVKNWSETPGSNSTIDGVAVSENCAFANMNNAVRAIMAETRSEVAGVGANVTAAATPDISTDGQVHTVTGVTTITGFATAVTGLGRTLYYETATPHTNSASLICPGNASYTTTKGDVIEWRSFGAGTWKAETYSKADGTPISGSFTGTLTSTDAGAGQGPDFIADRNSASPAANDIIGAFVMRGRDSGANATDYAKLRGKILDPTNASEDGVAIVSAFIAGTETDVLTIGPGVQIGAPTGGDKGAGTLNAASGLYVGGFGVAGPKFIAVDERASGTHSGGATSGSYEKVTLNTERVDEIGITITSSTLSVPAGTYRCQWSVIGSQCDQFKSRLQNTSDATTIALGQNAKAESGADNQTSHGYAYFTLAATKNIELQRRVQTTNGTSGAGAALTFGDNEVYSMIELEKLA